jgi:hypothetical protein
VSKEYALAGRLRRSRQIADEKDVLPNERLKAYATILACDAVESKQNLKPIAEAADLL